MTSLDNLPLFEQQNHIILNNIQKIKYMMKSLSISQEWKNQVAYYFLEIEECLRIKGGRKQ